MASPIKVMFGFHAVGVRLKTAPASVIEVFIDPTRRDARMRQFQERAKEAKVKLVESDGLRLSQLAGSHGHQGVVARVCMRSSHPKTTRWASMPRCPKWPVVRLTPCRISW
jgi:23S rRNA (guanosine2251-2'-O)-methyltransferase